MKCTSLLIAIIFIVFASCKKDKKDSNCSLSAASIAGSYKITALTYRLSANTPEQDFFSEYFDDCEKDDITTLNTNSTYTYSDAGVTCSPDGSFSGEWAINGNTITIDGENGTVEEFTCNSFKVVANSALTEGDKISFTYTRQ